MANDIDEDKKFVMRALLERATPMTRIAQSMGISMPQARAIAEAVRADIAQERAESLGAVEDVLEQKRFIAAEALDAWEKSKLVRKVKSTRTRTKTVNKDNEPSEEHAETVTHETEVPSDGNAAFLRTAIVAIKEVEKSAGFVKEAKAPTVRIGMVNHFQLPEPKTNARLAKFLEAIQTVPQLSAESGSSTSEDDGAYVDGEVIEYGEGEDS